MNIMENIDDPNGVISFVNGSAEAGGPPQAARLLVPFTSSLVAALNSRRARN